jgi:hypothetical protein
LISIYVTFIQSDEFDFHNRSYAICELAMFHANLAVDCDQAYQRIKVKERDFYKKSVYFEYLELSIEFFS